MTHEYHLLPRCLRWMLRFRKRCGYGVHSPLAFDFITGVIYNKEQYYAYAALRRPLLASISRADEYDPESGLTAKDLRLLFRLTNYQAPATIALLGASAVVSSYITAARRSATVVDLAAADACPELLYVDSPALLPAALLSPAAVSAPVAEPSTLISPKNSSTQSSSPISQKKSSPESTMIIVRGIRRDAASRARWQQLQQSPDVTLTFDLGRFGIALKRPKINRQHYVVNYF